MNIRTFALLCLLGCSQTDPPPVPPAPVVVVPKKTSMPWDEPGWFPRTVAESGMLRDHIAKQLDAVVGAVEKTDPALAADLRTKATDFRSLVPSMIVNETPDHDAIFAQDGCTQEPCERFVSEDMAVVAVWRMGLMGVNYHAINAEFTPYVVFHELYHRNDPTAIAARETDYVAGVSNRWETEAWNYQSRVMNAATDGKYQRLIHAWAGAVQQGIVPSINAMGVVNAPVPNDFATLFNRGVGNSDLALQGFAFMFEYDLNRELIRMSRLTDDERTEALTLLYNRLGDAPTVSPVAATLVRESMRSWRRPQ